MNLLSLSDPRWAYYRGGYNRAVLDVVSFLTKLQSGVISERDWAILWDDLHHQGDVGEASYAVVPYLVEYARAAKVIEWHVFGFTAVVELERTENRNPPVPAEIELSYRAALNELPQIGFNRTEAWGEHAFEPFMACLALSLGRRNHARAYLDMTEAEIEGFYRYMENG
ncbi:hypothetical protein [Rudaea cellulosilytica]|uniref:hypothetical protein n=1 Tax=Rudaea cellulosilytica TaxID=540746 RepID=UPI000360DF44|nr:hypothetical protein [Rudaea cellulosilytica]